jgi:trehalose synthase
MADGVGGVLVDSVDECAVETVRLLSDRDRARELGKSGQERVKQQFLIPRLVLNELELLHSLETRWTPAPPEERFANRDPVCGMALDPHQPLLENAVDDVTYRFCSERCYRQFTEAPRHYLGAGSGGTG